MNATDTRHVLKTETAAAHRALEQVVGPIERHEDYIAYVRGLHAFRAPFEVALGAASLAPWRPTQLAELLEEDLRHLGAAPLAPERVSGGLEEPGAALGALYVLEGSTLGARILLVQVQTLGLDAHGGAKHLWRQAAALENWRAFLPLLQSVDARDMHNVTAGANAAFLAAERAMTRARHG